VILLIEESERMNTEHETKKLGFLGCGNMSGAILEGILAHGELDRNDILVVENSRERTAFWAEKGVSVAESAETLHGVSGIILGVKPQSFDQAAADLGVLKTSSMVLSIMAGIDSDRISASLGPKARVVRVMPNTPCAIGMGISAIARGANATDSDMALASRIMSTVGQVVEVDEASMHAVTATSGSGPAYLFLLAESWIEASIATGLSRDVAEKLVVETIRGSAELLHRERDAVALRATVTSKGGTTSAGIESLERDGIRESLVQALKAAQQRGVELGSEISS
jgi:pyrroline-5-carboxylate reductase